ncbi:hypothetical protein ILYODFUR_020069 [Ilyodon furcidens]|uniref:Uncharacterized protein n=1 Tax=Ilyodon furcidens TaxID=33524 RepID=A0ABV0TNS0_9TELE
MVEHLCCCQQVRGCQPRNTCSKFENFQASHVLRLVPFSLILLHGFPLSPVLIQIALSCCPQPSLALVFHSEFDNNHRLRSRSSTAIVCVTANYKNFVTFQDCGAVLLLTILPTLRWYSIVMENKETV